MKEHLRGFPPGPSLILAVVLCAAPAQAYYHYVYYLTDGAPYTSVFAKFDLNALPDKTLTFLVADTGPATLAPTDDFSSILSQVEQAALVWNSVAGSELRVAFGGVKAANQASNSPGGDVVFVDLPPGLLGLGAPTLPAIPAATQGPNGSFVAFSRSTVMLTNDTSRAPGPSYLESFFTTAVHEMGHALGLQHTFTGSAMSQGVIRNTSRVRPINADDIAGLDLLYGNQSRAQKVGSIAGRVTSNGQGVALASVVAITSAGPAISSLTNPDGTYRIDGLPPNRYWVYVHPLPPDADIKGPFDAAGNVIAASGPVETLFYPGTRDPNQFGVVPVPPGSEVTGIDFSVSPRGAVPVYDMATYSYDSSGQYSVTPAFVDSTRGSNTIAAQAISPVTTPVPQSVTVPSFAGVAVEPYGSPVALGLYISNPLVPSTGIRHVLFDFGSDMYVLPEGLVLIESGPPSITSVAPNGDGTVTVAGANFGADSHIFFDGLPAAVSTPFTGDKTNGAITVNPPPGHSGQTAYVIVYNSDGQNSTFYQPKAPPTYTYPSSGAPQIAVTPTALPAGASALVDIVAQNMSFTDKQVTVGLGSFDVSVDRVWVLSPTHLIANVMVASGAALGASEASVINGFQAASQRLAFVTLPANPAQPSVLSVVNADIYQADLYPGASASLNGVNLALLGASPQVTLNDKPVTVASASANQINIIIPAGFPKGPAILKVSVGSSSAFPIAVQVNDPPPVIGGIINAHYQTLGPSQPARSGETVFLTLAAADPSLAGSQGRIHVTVGGVEMPVLQVISWIAPGTIQVAFQITQSFGGSAVPVLLTVDGIVSDPYTISVN